MRKITKGGTTITYPDEVGFAFNPCLITASGEGLEAVKLIVSSEKEIKGGIILVNAIKGTCYCDIREYVQAFFSEVTFDKVDYDKESKSNLGMPINIKFKAFYKKEDMSELFDIDTFFVWGAMKMGGQEIYNGRRTLTWFRGFPFTVGVYAENGGSIMVSKDGVKERVINIPEQGVWNIPLKSKEDDARKYYSISDCSGACAEFVFDGTFDMTFRKRKDLGGDNTAVEKVRINVVDGYDEGYYLRWIDRHGFYNYYLFKGGDESRKITEKGVFVRNNLMAYDMSYGRMGHAGRQSQMGRRDTISVCAPLVDSEIWDMLFDVTTSPCVDLFAGYKEEGVPCWIPITIVPGSYTKQRAALQDFMCNIVMPEVPVQKL
ncbi:hypothetical protein HMPREF1860_00538 [Prevotella amnii]|uniref:Uncharacterized protein n=1 Tax=Prevotella amnii TaxID=419005 RepID=A0A134BIM6_9BACT|nr:hypothetical protein [Prevotella amnii]KXB79769.1 hypothetical protein HMPREF1860_00538 [Prevotella amnii]